MRVSSHVLIHDAISCRKKNDKWVVAMNKWQTMTDMEVNKGGLIWNEKKKK